MQRWRLGDLNVTVDFLMPPTPGQEERVRVQNLEGDFGAVITPGLQLAFDERVDIELNGHTLHGERVRRTIPVCGPAAFVVLKALAFGDRAEPKDAYDLVYVIHHTLGRGQAIAERLSGHAGEHRPIVVRALALLAATSMPSRISARHEQHVSQSPSPPRRTSSTTLPPTPTATSRICSAPAVSSACSPSPTPTEIRVRDDEHVLFADIVDRSRTRFCGRGSTWLRSGCSATGPRRARSLRLSAALCVPLSSGARSRLCRPASRAPGTACR